jgi:DNA-binding MarR family transcriptional regulator
MSKVQDQLIVAIRHQLHAWEALRQALATHLGLGLTEYIALGHIYDEGPLTATSIGERLSLTSGSVTALINRLEAGAYAKRVANPEDRRSVLISITPAGRRAWEWALAETAAPVAKAVRASEISATKAIGVFEAFTDQVEKLTAQLT